MRIFALELDNDIKGIERRKAYIEGLIEKLPKPDIVVLPELAICSYMASQKIWKLADDCGRDASQWTVSIAKKYNTYIGACYLDKENGDYYNRYMIAGPDGVCGVVTKSEGESLSVRHISKIIRLLSPSRQNRRPHEKMTAEKAVLLFSSKKVDKEYRIG